MEMIEVGFFKNEQEEQEANFKKVEKDFIENILEPFDIVKIKEIKFLNDEYHKDYCHIDLECANGSTVVYSFPMKYPIWKIKILENNPYFHNEFGEKRYNEDFIIKKIKEIINEKSNNR